MFLTHRDAFFGASKLTHKTGDTIFGILGKCFLVIYHPEDVLWTNTKTYSAAITTLLI